MADCVCRMCGEIRKPVATLLDQNLGWVVTQLNIKLTPDLPTSVCSDCLHEIKQWFVCCRKSQLIQPIFSETLLNTSLAKATSTKSRDIIPQGTSENITEIPNNPSSELKDFSIQLERLKNETIQMYSSKSIITPIKTLPSKVLKSSNKKTRLYKCNICEKKFKTESYMRTCHFYRHINLRPFKCKICNKNFVAKCNLKLHIDRVHVYERKYKCSLCSKAFKSKGHLIEHIKRRHSNNYNYKCNECVMAYKTSGDLYRHRKKEHDR